MDNHQTWHIADISRLIDAWDEDDPGYEYVEVVSKEHLSFILRGAMATIGTTFSLESNDGIQLGICLSEKFGALMLRYPGQRIQKRVRSRHVPTDRACLFRSEGVESEIPPEDLLPIEEVIQSVLYFYENSSFPNTVVFE